MDILSTVSLESNSKIKINFDGGDLSSDSGLLLLKEFCCKIGAVKLVGACFIQMIPPGTASIKMMTTFYRLFTRYLLPILKMTAQTS